MDDLLGEFLTETAESLDVIDVELVRFESDPSDSETLNNIFRLVHTIKGTCGFIGLSRLQALAHAGETLLGKFRDGALKVTPEAVGVVLESIDRIKSLLAHLAEHQAEPSGDDEDLIGRLNAISEGTDVEAAPAVAAPVVAAPPPVAEPPPAEGRWDPDQGRNLRPGEVSLAELEAAFAAAEGPSEPKAAKPLDVDEDRSKAIGANSIRVSVGVLENLMTMVSELVLTRNQLMQMLKTVNDSQFKGPLQRLSGITAELQDCVMKTRMQPIGSAWKKLPRIVRDACQDLGKKIELVMEGEATELDRQVLELIRDPLTHMIRNSCDHGVEQPADRAAAGKPETGIIRLRAYHEGGHILIEVADDGAGLNTERIRSKAVEKGVLGADEAASMSDQQVHRLIFAPGFSTAAKVTSISGRGVGMDVVKTNVELIGGAIDLRSRHGHGTTFVIKIPLTLAIISALIVGAAEHRFALPQLSVVELVRAGARCEHRIEFIRNTRVLRLRDRLLPLVSLADVLKLSPDGLEDGEAQLAYVVVMQVGDARFGLIVDQVFDTEEIVVKPLSKRLGSVSEYSGATIMGDGAVIMILDPAGVAKSVSGAERQAARDYEIAEAAASRAGEKMSLLLFSAGSPEPRACPLSLVTRLEHLDASTFEMTRRGPVVQYRGKLMPLASAGGVVRREGRQPVLVFNQGDKVIGLAVDVILDIVEEQLDMQLGDQRDGVLGTAVLKGRSTEVVDVGHYLGLADPDWAKSAAMLDTRSQRRRVLLIEAHPFFRNLLGPLVKAAGYEVTVVETLKEAAQKLDSEVIDLVLADADDPRNETELAALAAQGSARIIPLSSLRETVTTAFGPSAPKSDRAALLAKLAEFSRKTNEAA